MERVKRSHTIEPTALEIRIDGVLSEAAWDDATKMTIDWEWNPGDNVRAPVETEGFITYDTDSLYFGFKAYDPDPSAIRAHYADRDTAFLDDTVGFILDTFGDQRRAFQFRINPLGVQMEAISSDVDGTEDWSWNIIWDSAGRITDEGYEVEVRIPFNQLRFPTGTTPSNWSLLLMRDYPRSSRHRLRSTYFDREKNCFVCQTELATGGRVTTQGRNLELTPTATGIISERRNDFPDGGLETADEDLDFGLTMRWGITPNMTLNAAVNPDFSQVEADSAQLAVNETFALFFPERRPFFLEGADLFNTRFNLVFTRTVADPIAGIKLTGKTGAHSYGLFAAQDEVNNLILPGYQGSSLASFDEDVTSAVVRYRRDVGERSTVGLLYTGRTSDDYDNHVFSLDGLYQVTDSDSIRYQVAGSSTSYPAELIARGQPDGTFDDYAYRIDYNHGDSEWGWWANYREVGGEFRADSGFEPRVGFRRGRTGIERFWRGGADKWYNFLLLNVGVDATQELDGIADEWGADFFALYQGPLQSEFWVNLAPNHEFFAGEHYDHFRVATGGQLRPSGDLFFGWDVSTGETIDRFNAQSADYWSFGLRSEFSLGRRFNGNIRHDFETLEVRAGDLYDANLTEGRFVYHVNLRTFVRAIVQYRIVEREVSSYTRPVEPETEGLFSQLLFSYKINPQTVALIGYSDNYAGFERVDLTQTDRTFFIKLGYAWLF